MNRFLKLSVIALGLAALPAFSQSNPATVPTSIKIITPITFNSITGLNFGTVAASNNGSSNTYTVSTAGTRSPSGGAGNGTVVTDGTNSPTAGAATMTSEGAYTVNLTAVVVSAGGGGLVLNNLRVDFGSGPTAFPATVASPAATTTLALGGDMTVLSGTTPNTYTGSFTLTGTYN